jgi:glycosyltransferase involved in cell wall biosynthesis
MHKIAYLANPYPAISHTFIFREIESLRKEGLQIATASISRGPHIEKMSPEEQQEAKNTFVLKEIAPVKGLLSLVMVFCRSPHGFLRMTLKAFSFFLSSSTRPGKALGYLAEAILLIAWLHRQQIVHIHEHFANPTALVALLCKTYGGFSYSISLHGPDIFYQVDSSQLQAKVSSAVFVRCISHYCKSQVMRILPYENWSNQHIVRCGVDGSVYQPISKDESTVLNILCVGRLCPAKGQHLLLETAVALIKKNYDFKLIFIGDGPDKDSLEQLSSTFGLDKHVTFAGVLGQAEVRRYYQDADIFVLPSFAEGVPVVLMEAMAMEIPVISTRITGIPELIEHGQDGLLATPGDSEALTHHVATLLSNPSLRKELGKAGRVKVTSTYDQEKNNRQLAEIFKKYGDPHALT